MDKYTSGAFASTKYGIYKSAQDIITSLPAIIIADGQSASAIIKGNMQQSGTPTPSSPIYPTETGDKTANLYNYKSIYSQYLINDDIVIANTDMINVRTNFTPDLIGEDITLSIFCKNVTSSNVYIRTSIDGNYVDSNKIGRDATGVASVTVTPTSTSDYFYLTYGNGGTYNTFNDFMINKGVTTLPYEPYGYKIPILSSNTTTNVYLGETQSTRKIRKLVFDGSETGWEQSDTGGLSRVRINIETVPPATNSSGYCTHYNYQIANVTGNCWISDSLSYWYFADSTNAADVTTWKSYLQQQYANNSPVTVWYVLSTPTTTILNEPIRKIGTYADSVSVSAIPTTAGSQTFDIDTTLKPSEVDLTYNGWHLYNDKKYTNGAWS